MNTPSTKTKCPRCGGRGTPIKGGLLKCKKGCGDYDARPNEHGYALHSNPERHVELKERNEHFAKRKAK